MIEKLFAKAIKPLIGSGIGRIKPLARMYQQMAHKILPNEKVIEVQGFKIKVVTQGYIGDISTELLFKGIHEPLTTKLFKRYIREGDVVVDIGANIGYFTLLASLLAGIKGKVFAFEPEYNNMLQLDDNLRLNHFTNVTPIKVALSDYNGRTKLFLSSSENAKHSLIELREHDGTTLVDVAKLDDILPPNMKVDFLKSDTEGNELQVLKGAKEVIKRSYDIKLLVEVYPRALYAQKVAVADIWEYLNTDLFFKYFYLVDDYKNKLFQVGSHLKITEYCRKAGLGCNLLCSRIKLGVDS